MTVIEDTISFAADHPALPGHFPGNPIVPGALLLAAATALVKKFAGQPVTGLRNAKFLTSLKPEVPCHFRLTSRAVGSMDLTCSAEGATILTAVFETGRESSAS